MVLIITYFYYLTNRLILSILRVTIGVMVVFCSSLEVIKEKTRFLLETKHQTQQ